MSKPCVCFTHRVGRFIISTRLRDFNLDYHGNLVYLYTKRNGGDCMNYFLRDVNIELWAQVKQKATIERKTMRDVIFEGLRLYLNPPASESVKAKPKRKAKV